ncbi:MAG TPA: hypothetical protein VFK44_02105 [Bacillales bacterium]|nr:hypothetical protein [Bacillales bacterium]
MDEEKMMYTYSATLIHVRRWTKLFPFFLLSILVAVRLMFHRDVERFTVKWVAPRTFRAFVLWKNGKAISRFRQRGIHGYVLRNAHRWIDWHAHLRGQTQYRAMTDEKISKQLRATKRKFFHANKSVSYR